MSSWSQLSVWKMRKVVKIWSALRMRRASMTLGERLPEMRQKDGITTALSSARQPLTIAIGDSVRSADVYLRRERPDASSEFCFPRCLDGGMAVHAHD